MALEHRERRRYCEQISRINTAMSADDNKRSLDQG